MHKKGPKDCPASYQTFSLVPIFPKILETVIHQQLYELLREQLFNDYHFGFLKGKSTTGALDSLIKEVLFNPFIKAVSTSHSSYTHSYFCNALIVGVLLLKLILIH